MASFAPILPAEVVSALSVPRSMAMPNGVRACRLPGTGGDLAVLEAMPPAGAEPRLPVLLVPGFTGSKEDFLHLLPLLAADGHPAWAIDMRGQHESGGPDDESAYAIDVLAAEVTTLLESLAGRHGPGRAHLVGHSFGGLVCRRAVLGRPPAAASFTLLDSGPAGIPPPTSDTLALLRPILEQGGVQAVWEAAGQLENDPAAKAAPRDVQEFLRRRFLSNTEAGLLAMAQALLDEPDLTDDLGTAGVPLLVAWGENDDAWPPAVQKDMAARLGADHAEVPGSVHSPAVENPHHTAAVLTSFWQRVHGSEPRGAR